MRSRASTTGADLVIVNTCGFLDSAQGGGRWQAIGTAMAENGRVIVTGCMGAEPEKITGKLPERASRDHRARSSTRPW